ncbi:MAG: helix-turn-helix domain-containing protein [Muribaculaceae bacterium]|nr:helix-turn-helix domain-containing protein [Muribaculaceae bacterium]
MDIISRLKQYMDYCQLSSSQFADAAGIPRPTLSQLLNGRNKTNEGAKKISSDIIRKLHDAYPRLNVMWLLFGDGDMESIGNTPFSEPQNDLKNSYSQNQIAANQDIQGQILFDDELSDLTPEKINSPEIANSATFVAASGQKFDTPTQGRQEIPTPTVALQPDKTKKVQSIMVFYSDNSFEIFKPSE